MIRSGKYSPCPTAVCRDVPCYIISCVTRLSPIVENDGVGRMGERNWKPTHIIGCPADCQECIRRYEVAINIEIEISSHKNARWEIREAPVRVAASKHSCCIAQALLPENTFEWAIPNPSRPCAGMKLAHIAAPCFIHIVFELIRFPVIRVVFHVWDFFTYFIFPIRRLSINRREWNAVPCYPRERAASEHCAGKSKFKYISVARPEIIVTTVYSAKALIEA